MHCTIPPCIKSSPTLHLQMSPIPAHVNAQTIDLAFTLQASFTLLPLRFAKAVSCLVQQQFRKGSCSLKGDQLFDMICVGIFACTVLFLRHLNAGAIYFWIKDLTQEFLKLQVIYTAVELFDKVGAGGACCTLLMCLKKQ